MFFKSFQQKQIEQKGREYDYDIRRLRSQVELLRTALRKISLIENEEYGPDWAEIEKAREIAVSALLESK